MTAPFITAVIDPPWPYTRVSANNKLSGYVSRDGATQYTTLSIEDMAALPISKLVEKYVFVWTVGPFIRESLSLLDAWGFEYKSQLCWIKDDKQLGVGYWFRGNHEFVLVGKKPGAASVRTGESSVLWHPRMGHSRKPDFLHELLERHFPGPFVEIFGRRTRNGWTVFGDQQQEQQPSLSNTEHGDYVHGDVRKTINEFISKES